MPRVSKSRQLERVQAAVELYVGQPLDWYPVLSYFGRSTFADTPTGTISIMLEPPAGQLQVGGSYFKNRSELECLIAALQRKPRNKSRAQKSLSSMKT